VVPGECRGGAGESQRVGMEGAGLDTEVQTVTVRHRTQRHAPPLGYVMLAGGLGYLGYQGYPRLRARRHRRRGSQTWTGWSAIEEGLTGNDYFTGQDLGLDDFSRHQLLAGGIFQLAAIAYMGYTSSAPRHWAGRCCLTWPGNLNRWNYSLRGMTFSGSLPIGEYVGPESRTLALAQSGSARRVYYTSWIILRTKNCRSEYATRRSRKGT